MGYHIVHKTQSQYIHRVHTLWDTILFTKHSPGTFIECTYYGIPYCSQNSPDTFIECTHYGIHIVYKTQSPYIHIVHTLWDTILFTKHSPSTFRKCTHYGIPYCLQSVNNMGSHSACTVWMYQDCVFYLAWWWFLWNETCRQIFNIYHYIYIYIYIVVLLTGINHYIIAIHNGMAPIKVSVCRNNAKYCSNYRRHNLWEEYH